MFLASSSPAYVNMNNIRLFTYFNDCRNFAIESEFFAGQGAFVAGRSPKSLPISYVFLCRLKVK